MRSGGRQTANCVQARACPGCVRRLSRRRILFGNRVPSRRHTDDLDFSFENRHQYGSTARSGNRSAREGLENLRRNRLLRLSREILARKSALEDIRPKVFDTKTGQYVAPAIPMVLAGENLTGAMCALAGTADDMKVVYW